MPMGYRILFFFLLFFLSLVVYPESTIPSVQELDTSARQFAKDLARRMCKLLYQAGSIDQNTSKEILEQKKYIISRQRELNSWLNNKGREVRFEDCKSKIDQQNYKEFFKIMATKEFLQLSYGERVRFISIIETYLKKFSDNFSTSLETMLYSMDWPDKDRYIGLANHLIQRLQKDIDLQVAYFNKEERISMGAVYVPNMSTIYFNLNSIIQSPSEFIDAFEHELWHHLLPPNGVNFIHENLWSEGFTEAISEIWSDHFYKTVPRRFPVKQRESIQYPVQTAFASIYLGLNRSLTMVYLARGFTWDDFIRKFSIDVVMSQQNKKTTKLKIKNGNSSIDSEFELVKKDYTPVAETVANEIRTLMTFFFHHSTFVDEKRKDEIEKLLRNWGWKEDNHQPVNISRYLNNGNLEKDRLKTAFIREKEFLLDFIRAITIINLRKIKELNLNSHAIIQHLNLPKHVKDNLIKVLPNVHNPDFRYVYP